MLRRDFLKLIGVAGTALSLPGLPNIVPRPPMKPEANGSFGSKEPEMFLGFEFYDARVDGSPREWVDVWPLQGHFTWKEYDEDRYLIDRGQLQTVRQSVYQYFEFELDMLLQQISYPNLLEKIRGLNCFNLQIQMGDETFKLHECFWDTLEYDRSQGALSVHGRMCNLILEAR